MVLDGATTTERTAELVCVLKEGRALTTAEAAKLLGITRQSAYDKLAQLCRVPSLRLTYDEGYWFSMDGR